jgi:DNA-binding cell septation regulator SpoVG
MEYKISRMNKGNYGKVIAFFDLQFIGMSSHFDMTVKGFKLVEGINGKFVSMPQQKHNDEYKDNVFADKQTRQTIEQMAIKMYENDGEEVLKEKSIDELVEESKDGLPF